MIKNKNKIYRDSLFVLIWVKKLKYKKKIIIIIIIIIINSYKVFLFFIIEVSINKLAFVIKIKNIK
jgi:hypothetical protein